LKDNMHRLMLSIPEELHNKLDALKKEKFYNDTKAEMYRFLIKNGLEFVAKSQRTWFEIYYKKISTKKNGSKAALMCK